MEKPLAQFKSNHLLCLQTTWSGLKDYNYIHTHILTHRDISPFPVHLTYMSLDCGWNPDKLSTNP